MRQRSIYLEDDEWRMVKLDAASRGVTNSQVVSDAIRSYFASHKIAVATESPKLISSAEEAKEVVKSLSSDRSFRPAPKPSAAKKTRGRGWTSK